MKNSKLAKSPIIAMCFILLLAGCKRKEYLTDSGMVWNTIYNITYESDRQFTDSILHVFETVGRSVSAFDSTSVVSRVNRSAEPVAVDSAFIKVYLMSQHINRISGGAFDPTLSPAIRAWGFGKGHKATADTTRIDSILTFVGMRHTRLEGSLLHKDDPRTEFNFSAIAKGFGVDQTGKMFLRNGVRNFLVEIGGEIYASGLSPRGGKWNVAIDKPNPDLKDRESQMVIEISDCGVATSGNYRNFQTGPDGNYGHTIDPATGRPARTDILSVTAVASSCMEADALATACMVLGKDKAITMAKKYNYKIMLILSDHTLWMSPGFKSLIKN